MFASVDLQTSIERSQRSNVQTVLNKPEFYHTRKEARDQYATYSARLSVNEADEAKTFRSPHGGRTLTLARETDLKIGSDGPVVWFIVIVADLCPGSQRSRGRSSSESLKLITSADRKCWNFGGRVVAGVTFSPSSRSSAPFRIFRETRRNIAPVNQHVMNREAPRIA